ncbi:uncharacterized protein LOC129975931 [Argiope bruennichi]|uniref:uncharacterized protein LOC129975931 n=1 Tax=Argiope bruennichi TaxID=94029 RepID=UPI002493E272|nr:uncharacterized protein LOC129975931 [Argiope bruennichi]
MSANITEKCDQLVIVRSLQVIGECMKSTTDSPNLSTETYELLLSFLPENIKEVITRLRDDLSHEESLSVRFEIEMSGQNVFQRMQFDITQMNLAVSDIIRRKKSMIFGKLLNKMACCKHIDAMKVFLKQNHIYAISLQNELEETLNLNVSNIEQLEKLFFELEMEMRNELDCTNELIRQIQYIVENACTSNSYNYSDLFKSHVHVTPKEIRKICTEEIVQIIEDFLALIHINEQFLPLYSISYEIENIPNAEAYREILAKIVAINELRKTESYLHKVNYFSGFSDFSQYLSEIQKAKQDHPISEREMKQLKNLFMILSCECDQKASRMKEIFSEMYSLFETEKNHLKNTQNTFREYLLKFIVIIKDCESEESSQGLEKLMLGLRKIESPTLPSYSKKFKADISRIFLNIFSEFKKDNILSGKRSKNVSTSIASFIRFGMGEIKWIKEFKQMLQTHKEQKMQKSNKKISETSKLKDLLSHKLTLLQQVSKEHHESEQFFENSQCSQKKSKLLSIIEMLTLDSLSILGCKSLPNRLSHNAFFLDKDYPIINGKNLRNHLAHGNALVSIVLEDECADILLNAEKMTTYNLLKSKQEIGKKVKNDPQKLKISLDGDLSTVSQQLKLFSALTEGKMEKVKDCISKGADVFGRDMRSQTSLHFAAKGPCLETVKFVLKFNLDVYAVDINLQTALHVASWYGRLATVEYLIQESKSSINCIDIYGRTPLHLAAINGHTDVVRCLLNHDAKMAPIDRFGNAALHYAIIHNHLTIASILLEKESGVDANKTFLGDTALHLASGKGHMNLVVYLLDKIPVNFRSDLNFVALHKAAKGGHTNVVELLITAGAKINAKSLKGTTPLHLAAEKGHYAVALKLLQHGADINITDLNGSTPLSFSIREGFLAVSELLLGKDIVIDSFRSSYECPLNLAAYFGHHELLKLMLYRCDTDFKISSLYLSAYMGHLTSVKFLIKKGVSIKYDATGCTALHFAACGGHTDIANFLISRGYDVNAKIISKEVERNMSTAIQFLRAVCNFNISQFSGCTSLHLSAYLGHKDTVRSLVKNQADLYIKDDNDRIPLQIIIERGLADILVEEKISVGFTEFDDYSPLHLGAIRGDLEFVEYCIQKGCDINARSRQKNETALYLAVFNDHPEVASYLMNCDASACHDCAASLEIAVKRNRMDIVNMLMNKNVDISKETEREYLLSAIRDGNDDIAEYFLKGNPENALSRPECHEFPLHSAVESGHLNIVKKLLELEIRNVLNEKNNESATPLELASVEGYCEIVRVLLEKGADPNHAPGRSEPLHMAVLSGYSEIIEILYNAGANLVNIEGCSAIELAIKIKNFDAMEKLLELSKFDINIEGHSGCTLLHNAAASGSLEIVKSLVEKGATINCRDSTNAKPIHIAAKEGHPSIVEYFLSIGVEIDSRGENGWSLLHYAAAGNQSDICKVLFKNGLSINIIDDNGCSALHVAAQMGQIDVLHTLLHFGAYYDFRNERNETPYDVAKSSDLHNIHVIASFIFISNLFSAVQKNNLPHVEALLNEGFEFSEFGYANIKNSKNLSLLHFAAWKGYEGIVDLLLKHNADPNAKTANGCTPLHYAAKFSYPKVARALLRSGAIFNAESNGKKTPLDFANDGDIIELLNILYAIFSKIENNEHFISDNLIPLKNLGIVKTVMRAKNSCGKTLTAFAIIKEHPEAESLKSLFQSDVTFHCQRADRLCKEGQFHESLEQYKVILEKRIDMFSDKDPGVLDIQEIISEILIKQERYDQAQSLIEKIFRIRKEILGDFHKDTLKTMRLMALILGRKERKREALNIYEDVLKKQQHLLGSSNEETLLTQIHIAQLMHEGEKPNDTVTKVRDFVLQLKTDIAKQLCMLREPSEALEIFKDVFEIQKKSLGLYHTETSNTLFCVAFALFVMNRKEESLKTFRETLDLRYRVLGPDNEKTLHSRYWVANALYSLQMFQEAYEIYKADLEARVSILGVNHPDILDTQNKIASILSQVTCD